jgi:hypothetical protein
VGRDREGQGPDARESALESPDVDVAGDYFLLKNAPYGSARCLGRFNPRWSFMLQEPTFAGHQTQATTAWLARLGFTTMAWNHVAGTRPPRWALSRASTRPSTTEEPLTYGDQWGSRLFPCPCGHTPYPLSDGFQWSKQYGSRHSRQYPALSYRPASSMATKFGPSANAAVNNSALRSEMESPDGPLPAQIPLYTKFHPPCIRLTSTRVECFLHTAQAGSCTKGRRVATPRVYGSADWRNAPAAASVIPEMPRSTSAPQPLPVHAGVAGTIPR